MSLRPDDRSSRGRSSSKTRERSRSRSNVRTPRERESSPPEIVSRPETISRSKTLPSTTSSTMPGAFDDGRQDRNYRDQASSQAYNIRAATTASSDRPEYARQTSQSQQRYSVPPQQQGYYSSNTSQSQSQQQQQQQPYGSQTYQPNSNSRPYPSDDDRFIHDNYWKDFPVHERPGFNSNARYPQSPDEDDHHLAYGDTGRSNSRQTSYSSQYDSRGPQAPYQPQSPAPPSAPYGYGQYSDSRGSGQYNTSNNSNNYQDNSRYTQSQSGQYAQQQQQQQQQREHSGSVSAPQRPGLDTRHSLSANRLSTGMGLLSVGGDQGHGAPGSGGLPPPSPLLEAYRGTWQQVSPMPLAIRPTEEDDDLSELEELTPSLSRTTSATSTKAKEKGVVVTEKERKKRVQIYDKEGDANKMADALGHSKVDAGALCDILPGLAHDDIIHLRTAYKKQVKVQGKGVNLPKHIKTKTTGNFGKVAYVTALGRWESEGYWANFFYQSHGSRRELLIESLMGRTNAEIKNIEEDFKDKRYNDSLVRCMEKELKMDKFRTAILLVLEQERQEEQDVYRQEYRQRDADMLHRALTAKQGGESVMLEIIVRRSDAHLREVLKIYERDYHENFPRAALKKSNNLVGEVIAHILNGVINKPARDAILLHHAISDIASKNKDDELRYELLISRLVRLHWDRPHLARVKKEYYTKYEVRLEDDIEEATRGDFCEFLIELCNVRGAASLALGTTTVS